MDNRSKTIYKRCYFIACAVILLDLILKFNATEWEHNGERTPLLEAILLTLEDPLTFFNCTPQYIHKWLFFWAEAALLTFLFCFNLFSHAKQGVLLSIPKWDGKKFPWKRYLLISVIPSLVVAICLWLRWIIACSSEGFNIVVAFKSGWAFVFLFLILWAFLIIFTILFVSFVIAYFIARKAKKAVEAES